MAVRFPSGAAADASSKAVAVTKQQIVYRTLREAILRCELRPGARLVIDDIARQHHVSIIPVREALRQLQAEGLVLTIAHVGGTVAPISFDSVVEVFTVLEGLEAAATRAAAERAGPDDVAELARLVEDMDAAIASGSPGRWAELNTEFHLAIGDVARMPMLRGMLRRAFDHWERVRRYYFSDVLIHRTHLAQAEHQQLLDQIRARDLVRLEQTIRQHNRGALAAYSAYLDSPMRPHADRRVRGEEQRR
jgi:DNA-binding GntR family transcriptional regulator